MRATTLVVMAVTSAVLVTLSLVSQKNSTLVYQAQVLPWPTVPSLQVQARWLDTGGDLNSEVLQRFVKKYSKVTTREVEEEEITSIKV